MTAKPSINCIHPAWPAPANIIAGVTTRTGGTSEPPYDSCNLGLHVGDDDAAVSANRALLNTYCASISGNTIDSLQWQWLNQTHSTKTQLLKQATSTVTNADACTTSLNRQVCVVLTADCLPILLCDANGSAVAAIHAGWRGLAAGVVENAVTAFRQSMNSASDNPVYAWIGPAIGPGQFEVGDDVKNAFLCEGFLSTTIKNRDAYYNACEKAFVDINEGKYLADIYQLATIALRQCNIHAIYGGGFCTFNEADRFYSYRRNKKTGRMASFIFKT